MLAATGRKQPLVCRINVGHAELRFPRPSLFHARRFFTVPNPLHDRAENMALA